MSTPKKLYKSIHHMIKKGAFTVPLDIAQQLTNKTLTQLIQEGVFPIADSVYEQLEHEGAGAFLCIVKDGVVSYILTVQRSAKGEIRLAFPGGAAQAGETPDDTLAREVREEIGSTLDNLGATDMWRRYAMGGSGARADSVLFMVKPDSYNVLREGAKTLTTKANASGATVLDVVLVSADELRRYLADEQRLPVIVSLSERVWENIPLRPWNYTMAKLHLLGSSSST